MIKIPVSRFEYKLTRILASNGNQPRLDKLMIMVSNPYKWIWPGLILTMLLIYFDWKAGIQALLLSGISASIADSLNTRLLKPNTDRIRPWKQYGDIASLGSMNKGRKSFPSNHASNTMSFAMGIGLIFPGTIWILASISFLVGYSRIYCGAHYPLDVLVGWNHGAGWVFLLYTLAHQFLY
jgi:undecaprenyl-diphosphatase